MTVIALPDSLGQHQERWAKALAGRQNLTREMWIDKLVASNKSWSPDELDVFWQQDREPSNYPILHTVLESVCGLEATSRRDASIVSRTSKHRDTAEALTGLVKYVDQANKVDQVRSKAFRSAATVGVGWTEVFYQENVRKEQIGKRNVDAMHIWCDPTGREDDLSDYQDIFRARWLPKHWADMRFNGKGNNIMSGRPAPRFDYDVLSHTQDIVDKYGDEPPVGLFNGGLSGDANFGPGHGMRAPNMGYGWAVQDGDTFFRTDRYSELQLLVERWYRADEWAQFVIMRDGRVIVITPQNADRCAEILIAKEGTYRREIDRKIRCAIFEDGGALLMDQASPYSHGQFPFIPTWAYRDEEGQPMGIVRLLRDPAREFNMRRTHLLKMTLMQQLHYEEGAFEDEGQAKANFKKYNGVVKYQEGKLDKARARTQADMSPGAAQLEDSLLHGAQDMLQKFGPVNQETLGQATSADSGVAIENRQQQAHVVLFHLFDQRNMAQQCETEQTLSLIQDAYSMEKEVRITGASTGLRYIHVNAQHPETGAIINDTSQGAYDCIIEEQPETGSVRAAKMQAIGQLFQNVDLPPAQRFKLAIAMAEAQDLPLEVMEILQEAQKMAEQPRQAEPQERKSIMDILKIDFATLAPDVQAQLITSMGVKVQPGQPVTQAPEGAPTGQPNPDILAAEQGKLAVQQSKNAGEALKQHAQHEHEKATTPVADDGMAALHSKHAHEALQNEAQRHHEAQETAKDLQHQETLARLAQGTAMYQQQVEHNNRTEQADQQNEHQQQQAQQAADLAPEPTQAGGSD